jgi:2'-5' RNA ligase
MPLESMSLPERRARSALLILVPEVASLVETYRRSYTADGASVPPHITLLCPFLAPSEIPAAEHQRIAQAITDVPQFDFMLTSVNRFPTGVMYLAPAPADPFRMLIDRLRRAFAEVAPYWDGFADVVPHVTVADAALTDDATLTAIERVVANHLPVWCAADEVVLMQRIRPAPAPWDIQGRFPLARAGDGNTVRNY